VVGIDRRHLDLEERHAGQADRLVEAGALAQHLAVFLVIGAALHRPAAGRDEIFGVARPDGVDIGTTCH
jgi:hypothetical protein